MTRYTIPAGKVAALADRIGELNRRAARLRLPPVTYSVGPVRYEPIVTTATAEGVAAPLRSVVDVEINGEAPRVAGWSFLAALEHHEAGALIQRSPWGAEDIDLSAWAHAGPACSHCGLDRRRKSTYLVRNEAGDLKQVGSTCLEDFTRSPDAVAAAGLMALWAELTASLGDSESGEWGLGSAPWEVAPLAYLAAAFASIRERGYHKAGGMELSTRTDADAITGPPPKGERERRLWEAGQPTPADRARAEQATDWIRSTAAGPWNEYLHNLRIIVDAEVVPDRGRGILASAPVAFDRELARKREREAAPVPPDPFGKAGERFQSPATVEFSRGFEGYYGSGTIIVLRLPSGHRLKYFASGKAADLDDYSGEWVLTATVKKHDKDRDGTPITVITRGTLRRPNDPSLAAKPRRPSKRAPSTEPEPDRGSHRARLVGPEWRGEGAAP